MPGPRVAMRRIKEVLRLKVGLGLSDTAVSRSVRIARSQRCQSRPGVPKTPKSGVGSERNQVPLSAEITCRLRPKSGAGLLRFLQALRQGAPALADGPRRADRRGARGD